jgi:UPF0755 protein
MVHALRFILLLAVIAVLGVGAFTYWIWAELKTPVSHDATSQPISVARGERLDQILSDLAQRGVIHSTLPLRVYMKAKKQELLVQAGDYVFPSPITPLQVLTRLQQGGDFQKLTIIEGWTRWDIADALMKVPSFNLHSKAEALGLLNDVSLIKDLDPKAQNLEGYLFPDTYFVVTNSSAKEIVSKAVERFRQVWNTDLKDRAQLIKMTPHQAVTMGSIIETEAKLKSERPVVASVIYNRLSKKMPLSMDSTVVYASKMAGAWRNNGKVYKSDVERKSPYNTRIHAGLPPGPVGSPGESSLRAAVYPASTNYIFYVRDPDRNDGTHNFYADAKSFEVGVQKLRAWEARQKPGAPR